MQIYLLAYLLIRTIAEIATIVKSSSITETTQPYLSNESVGEAEKIERFHVDPLDLRVLQNVSFEVDETSILVDARVTDKRVTKVNKGVMYAR
mgnify:CR=1 FL=1